MSRAASMCGVLAVIACIGGPAALAVSLSPAIYEEQATVQAGARFESDTGLSIEVPETISLDVADSLENQGVVRVITSRTGPQVDVIASAHGSSQASASGNASVYYSLMINPSVPEAPEFQVPLRVTVRASGMAQGNAGAYVEIGVPDPLGILSDPGIGAILIRRQAYSRADGNVLPDDPPTSFNLNMTFTLPVPVSTELFVWKVAGASGQGNDENHGTGEAQAVADPIFEIDPDFFVDIDGELIPGSELYSITYSDGILPIPEPGTALPIAGLLAARIARRPTDRAATSRHI